MTDGLLDRYKGALRRGHVALVRGQLEEALDAYDQAVGLAPDRPLPHLGRGTVLGRMGRAAEALDAHEAALRLAPDDEPALTGRAEALTALGRRVDAASAWDAVADARERAGLAAGACEAMGNALEQAESRQRRRQLRALVDRLDGQQEPATAAARTRAAALLDPSSTMPAADAGPAEPELDGPSLVARAEDHLEADRPTEALADLLAAAEAFRATGSVDAALDACYLALGVAPGDPALHLLLTRLYTERGWRAPAAEKLRLLDRLTALADDQAGRAEVRRLVAALADEAADDDEGTVPTTA